MCAFRVRVWRSEQQGKHSGGGGGGGGDAHVVDDPQARETRQLLHVAVEGAAEGAVAHVAAPLEDPLHQLLAHQRVHVRVRQRLQARPAVDFLVLVAEQHPAAGLADLLQHLDGPLEVADVKHGQRERDVAEVAQALLEHLPAGGALGIAEAHAEVRVHDAVLRWVARAGEIQPAVDHVQLRDL